MVGVADSSWPPHCETSASERKSAVSRTIGKLQHTKDSAQDPQGHREITSDSQGEDGLQTVSMAGIAAATTSAMKPILRECGPSVCLLLRCLARRTLTVFGGGVFRLCGFALDALPLVSLGVSDSDLESLVLVFLGSAGSLVSVGGALVSLASAGLVLASLVVAGALLVFVDLPFFAPHERGFARVGHPFSGLSRSKRRRLVVSRRRRFI